MATSGLNMSRRIRRTPYTDRVESVGVRGFSVVNHTLFPKAFAPSAEEDYWHLSEHVQIWDVGCQRQVEIRGRDAARLAQWLTPRDLRSAKPGQCLYVPLIDEQGGMLNDPILLVLGADHFWFSIADSDVLLWAKGFALGAGLDVEVIEPDVWPLAIQGPKAEQLMASVFGERIRRLGFFEFDYFDFEGGSQLIARSGYSKQDGFEIYLNDSKLGSRLWDVIWEAGTPLQITPGCPNLIDRVEAGLLSYGNEMTRSNNPLECGLRKYCCLDRSVDYIGRPALERIDREGVERMIRGVLFDAGRCPPCGTPWPVTTAEGDTAVGQITTAAWSPRFQRNVGLSLIERCAWDVGTPIRVHSADGLVREGELVALPFDSAAR